MLHYVGRAYDFVKKFEEEGLLNPALLRFATLVMTMVFVGHLIGCGLHLVAVFETPTAFCLADVQLL